ncbi:MAG: hypothetical protein WC450_12625, partial [Candidatus Omnitrophota bacterium]
MNKIILDLCGGSGAWSEGYRKAGYDVRLITLPAYDVRTYLPPGNVYGILAAPTCTDLAGCGAKYWKEKGLSALFEALAIVDACMRIILISNPVFWCLENPVGRLVHYLGNPRLIFNPCDYGDPYTKRTCLWGNFNIPKKNPVEPIKVCSQGSWVQKLGGKSERTKMLRSITPPASQKHFLRRINNMIELNRIYQGDCLSVLKSWPNDFIDCVVCSPPYWGLRSYSTTPVIWDGVPECQHIWVDNSYVRNNDQTAGEKQKTNAGSVGRDVPVKSGVCQSCNAWR